MSNNKVQKHWLIKKVWYGQLPLWQQFWLFGVAGGLSLHLGLAIVLVGLTEPPEDYVANWILGFIIFLMIYTTWIFVGIWRSAKQYRGDSDWVIAAKLAVSAGVTLYVLMLIRVIVG
ncbi:MAG: hypothetical protein HQL69_07005 [Magnetococcales bacterium]|nr:hypothetical protein [Magnetococcales bacterium]